MLSSDNIQCFNITCTVQVFIKKFEANTCNINILYVNIIHMLYEYVSIQVSMIGMTQQISFYKICKFHINSLYIEAYIYKVRIKNSFKICALIAGQQTNLFSIN